MKFLITVITLFLKSLVVAVFSPIDLVIYNNLPELSQAITDVGQFFNWVIGFMNWLLSWLPLSVGTFNFIISIWVFKLTIPLIVESVKSVVRWWHALAP